MLKLERIMTTKEKDIEAGERRLEQDAKLFDEFLKDNDKMSSDAIVA